LDGQAIQGNRRERFQSRESVQSPRQAVIQQRSLEEAALYSLGEGTADEEAQRALDYHWNHIVDDGTDLNSIVT
jgi:hypothetical protein